VIVIVNGRRVWVGGNVTVALLLRSLGYAARGVAVALNRALADKAFRRGSTRCAHRGGRHPPQHYLTAATSDAGALRKPNITRLHHAAGSANGPCAARCGASGNERY
jgi:sulfur carrier protein ThiS